MSQEKRDRNEAIRLAYSRGYSQREIAAAYGISPQRVRHILDPERHLARRREWRRRAAEVRDAEAA